MLFSSLPNLCFVLEYSVFLFARFEGRISEEEEENSIDILARFLARFISIAFFFARKSRAEGFWIFLEILRRLNLLLRPPRVSTFSTMKKLLGLRLNQRPSAQ